jgi:hypothetical protein
MCEFNSSLSRTKRLVFLQDAILTWLHVAPLKENVSTVKTDLKDLLAQFGFLFVLVVLGTVAFFLLFWELF